MYTELVCELPSFWMKSESKNRGNIQTQCSTYVGLFCTANGKRNPKCCDLVIYWIWKEAGWLAREPVRSYKWNWYLLSCPEHTAHSFAVLRAPKNQLCSRRTAMAPELYLQATTKVLRKKLWWESRWPDCEQQRDYPNA